MKPFLNRVFRLTHKKKLWMYPLFMCHSKNVGLKKLNQIGYRQLRKIICYFKLKSVLRSQNFYFKKKQRGKPDMPVIKTYRQRSITQQIGRWNEKLRKNIQVFNKNWILDCSKCNNVFFSHFDQSLNSCSNKKFNKRYYWPQLFWSLM